MNIDRNGVREATHALLKALGYDPDNDDAIRDTPDRVARAWTELLCGRPLRAEEVLGTTFDAESYDEIIALNNIEFSSMCEHHLLPFRGHAHVAYIPKTDQGRGEPRRVVGLSKLARLVEMHARRLQLQERMTFDIARDLSSVLDATGVAVIVEAQHLCMCARGVAKNGATMRTSAMLGVFREQATARAEVMTLLLK